MKRQATTRYRAERRRNKRDAPGSGGRDHRSLERKLRAIRRSSFTRKIVAGEKELRRRINTDAQLADDFEFLVKKTGWQPNLLLKRLYWDSNIIHADRQTILREAEAEAFPVDPDTLKAIRRTIPALADQIERVNQTELSPARTIILRNEKGGELSLLDAKRLRWAFSSLPEILNFYLGELYRKVSINTNLWPEEKEDLLSIIDETRLTSLYECIRLADSKDQYNSVRLLRLVNVSREVQGLPPVKWRAFVSG